MKTRAIRVLLPALLFAAGLALPQDPRPGPIPAPPDTIVKRIPRDAVPPPPPLPPEEIIQKFSQKESEYAQARAAYTFRKVVRIVEFGEDGKPAGEFQITTEPAPGPDGKRYEKIVEHPPSTLKRLSLTPEDLDLLARIPLLPLTTENLPKYELTYAGKQPVDELTTYVFRVKPRQLERTRAYFEGLVWVDDRDLAVVKSYGKWITETGSISSAGVMFTLFETYRELADGKYWFPTYSRSDDTLKTKNADVPLRLTIRWQEYKKTSTSP